MAGPGTRRDGYGRLQLAALLALSFILRVVLALRGGQGFWPDETRYGMALGGTNSLLARHWHDAAEAFFGHADHVLFRIVSLPPAIVEALTVETWPGPALYLGLFSVLSIWLIWKIALRAGADEREALFAAFFAACANSLFFYSRHYFPYDPSLAMMLASLYVGLGPSGAKRSALCGLLAGLGFLTYNGYWLLGGVVLGAHVVFGEGGAGRGAVRAFCAGAGLIAPIAIMLGISTLLGFHPLAGYRANAATIVQGDFGIGYRVVAEYFWSAEGPLFLLWLVAGAWALIHVRQPGDTRRIVIWASCLAGTAGGLIFFSDVIEKFVIYGRLAREMTPFLCLLAAAGARRWVSRRPASSRAPAIAAWIVVGVAAVNFATPLGQVFPAGFPGMAAAAMRTANAAGPSSYRTVFADPLWGADVEEIAVPRGETVLSRRNPLQFKPYQFESLDALDRKRIDRTDIAMRVVRTFGPLADVKRWDGYPGPVRLTVKFPADRMGLNDPLLTSGRPGAGDFIYVRYLDPGHVLIGHDHWGGQRVQSPPIAVDYAKPHEVAIIAGSVVPPAGSRAYAQNPVLEHLRGRLAILLDGAPVLSLRTDFNPTGVSEIYFGLNLIGGSTVTQSFGGQILALDGVSEAVLAGVVPTLMARPLFGERGPEWNGAIGPIQITFDLPPPGIESHPLLSVGTPGHGQVVTLVHDSPGIVQLGLERTGLGTILSEPMPAGLEPMVLEVSLGSMLPAEGAAVYTQSRAAEGLRDRAVLRLNDRPALVAPLKLEPSPQVVVGANTVGGTIARPYFGAVIRSVKLLAPEAVQPGTQLNDFISPTAAETADNFIGPLKLEVQFPRGRVGVPEPLIVSGVPGAADFLYVLFDSEYSLRFGFDHWGSGGRVTEPIEFEPGRLYNLVVNFGSFFPAPGSEYYRTHAAAEGFRNRLYVTLDGAPVFDTLANFHPLQRDKVTIGENTVGGSTAGTVFTGRIRGLTRVEPAALAANRIPVRPGWSGYPGPLEFRVQFPANAPTGQGEPLLTTGTPGAGDFLFVRYEGNGMARLGFDHWGMTATLSDPFPLKPGMERTMLVSMGSLFPPAGRPLYAARPELGAARGRMVVVLDGTRLIDAEKPSHASLVEQITIGTNAIGGSSASSSFTGRISLTGLGPLDILGP